MDKNKVNNDRPGRLLKSLIFVIQKEFCQKSIDARLYEQGCAEVKLSPHNLGSNVAALYDEVPCSTTSVPLLTNQKFVVGGW